MNSSPSSPGSNNPPDRQKFLEVVLYPPVLIVRSPKALAGRRILDGLDERPTPELLMTRSEVWRPLRSVAGWFLWRLTDQR